MPDDNSSVPNPAATSAPILPTVAVDAGVPPVPNAPAEATAPAEASVPAGDVAPAVSDGAPTATSSPVVEPTAPATEEAQPVTDTETPAEVARKIGEAHNVLIALSSDPSVDEMAAAIGLSLYLDKLGKRATAIYSGQTPNALEFLKPEETFESSVDTLQDFVIALNKDKADHLRYKLDGDYVKIYITPYRSRIGEEDLEFSYGDYNVDLVLALDVANGVDLDSALREHGRIMHDAVIIDITTGNPGKLGEIEWSDKTASSVSEMIARLLYSVNSKAKIEKEEATAFLTGIVAATNRFANANTTSETMRLCSKLIDSGANQQLVSKNITPDIENEMLSMGSLGTIGNGEVKSGDPTLLDIEHGNEEGVDESKVVSGTVTEKESSLLDDLKAAEASLAGAGAEITPELENEPLKIDNAVDEGALPEVADAVKQEAEQDTNVLGGNNNEEVKADEAVVSEPAVTVENGGENAAEVGTEAPGGSEDSESSESSEVANNEAAPAEDKLNSGMLSADTAGDENPSSDFVSDKPEKVLQPSSDFMAGGANDDGNKYGHMLEDALASADAAPNIGGASPMTAPEMPMGDPATMSVPAANDNPAVASAPAVAANPEINGVPEINYMPMPGEEVLPPPPTPPIAEAGDVNTNTTAGVDAGTAVPAMNLPTNEPIQPAAPVAEPVGAPAGDAGQAAGMPANDSAAFKIPGM